MSPAIPSTTTTVLISGAASGLGAAFVDAYRVVPATHIIAVDRAAIKYQHDNCTAYEVDIADEASVAAFAEQLQASKQSIDIVIHSAGIRGLVPHLEDQYPDNVEKCETLESMDAATMQRAFQINTVGTFLLIRALLPCLEKAPDPKVIVMSSRMGSIGNNQVPNKAAGGAYAYRSSKAALNALVRSFAVDVPSICFILCHPGRVETKLVRCKEEGAITPEESVLGLVPLIDTWKLEDSGKFVDRFGVSLPW